LAPNLFNERPIKLEVALKAMEDDALLLLNPLQLMLKPMQKGQFVLVFTHFISLRTTIRNNTTNILHAKQPHPQ
jgi:hypothetical protein